MRAQDVIRIARDRAGLTQQQLAARTGRSQEIISRWEAGSQAPSLDAVTEIVDACGLDLVLRLATADPTLVERAREQLDHPPLERLARLLPPQAVEDAARALRLAAAAEAPVIVVGQLAAALLGAPQRPDGARLDLVPWDPTLTERDFAVAGLAPLDADDRWRDSDIREPWTFADGAVVAIARDIPGTHGFRDLRRSALDLEIGDGASVVVAHPRDLLRIADASPRDSERSRVPGLQALLEVSAG